MESIAGYPEVAGSGPGLDSGANKLNPSAMLAPETGRCWQMDKLEMLGLKQFRNAAITIAGIELMHRIRKGQFGLRRFGSQGRAAPAVWNAVLRA